MKITVQGDGFKVKATINTTGNSQPLTGLFDTLFKGFDIKDFKKCNCQEHKKATDEVVEITDDNILDLKGEYVTFRNTVHRDKSYKVLDIDAENEAVIFADGTTSFTVIKNYYVHLPNHPKGILIDEDTEYSIGDKVGTNAVQAEYTIKKRTPLSLVIEPIDRTLNFEKYTVIEHKDVVGNLFLFE